MAAALSLLLAVYLCALFITAFAHPINTNIPKLRRVLSTTPFSPSYNISKSTTKMLDKLSTTPVLNTTPTTTMLNTVSATAITVHTPTHELYTKLHRPLLRKTAHSTGPANIKNLTLPMGGPQCMVM